MASGCFWLRVCHVWGCARRHFGLCDTTSAELLGSDQSAARTLADPGGFADNPIVYFVVTDRFFNGNPDNDRSYGRRPDGDQEIGTFHGGDLAGLTAKLKDGYFDRLGINGILITAPYEQIHGWVVGGSGEFKHFAYHGNYALDYTVLDKNMGSEDELAEFIATAHAQDIRVIFDVVMNHPGHADHQTMAEYGIDVLWDGWEKATPGDYHSYIDYNSLGFGAWWGRTWVRAALPGYEEADQSDERQKSLDELPDFKTESPRAVTIPDFLRKKPDTRAKTIPDYTVRDYLVKWLTDWVRNYGADGFRCDAVRHVDRESWAALKTAGLKALGQWKAANPDRAIDDAAFWMTGDVASHGVERNVYFDHGFDNLINSDFQNRARALGDDWNTIDAVYVSYAQKISTDPTFNVLSYLSSHDTLLFPRDRLITGGTALLLAPGGVQIFYGDETARPPGTAPDSDRTQATRSPMNWDTIERDVLDHWRRLGQFRRQHVSLAKGRHRKLANAPYTFARIHPRDRVVVAIGAAGVSQIYVADVFSSGDVVRDAYTGTRAVIKRGKVTVSAHKNGVVLLEKLQRHNTSETRRMRGVPRSVHKVREQAPQHPVQ